MVEVPDTSPHIVLSVLQNTAADDSELFSYASVQEMNWLRFVVLLESAQSTVVVTSPAMSLC